MQCYPELTNISWTPIMVMTTEAFANLLPVYVIGAGENVEGATFAVVVKSWKDIST